MAVTRLHQWFPWHLDERLHVRDVGVDVEARNLRGQARCTPVVDARHRRDVLGDYALENNNISKLCGLRFDV